VEDRTYPFLEINNSYVLFLRFVPSTNGYTVANFGGEFVIENKSFRALLAVGKPDELRNGNDLSTLLGDKSSFSAKGCKEVEK
jgi:hypothetical protein